MNARRWVSAAGAALLPLGLVGLAGATAAAGTRTWKQVDQDAHGEAQGTRGRLVRIGVQQPAEAERFDVERWRGELATTDLERREASYERLLEIARGSPAARAALDEWANGTDELAWTARMARRELGRISSFAWLGGGPAANNRRGEGLFGDRQLEERLREIESMLNGMTTGADAWTMRPPNALVTPGTPNAHEQFQSYSIEVGPDGTHVKVQEQVGGSEQTREYEGATLDEILRANPKLRETIQVHRFDLDGQALFGRLFEHLDDPLTALGVGEPPTDILGIEFDAPSAELADQLGLEPGLGLSVLRTEPGTIAHILGLQRGDVVVELNQIPLYRGDDVSRVLAERLPEAPVAVTIVDSKGKRRTLTWKPSLAPR